MNKKTIQHPHIGLNAHLLSLGENYRGAGISWYIYNLLQHLPEGKAPYQYTVMLNERAFKPPATMQLVYPPFSTQNPVKRILWEQSFQPVTLKQAGVDLYHALAFAAPVAMPCPFVVTVFDLSFRHFPQAFRPFNRLYLNALTAYSAKRAARVITISESTRQDVIRFYNIAPEKVTTIYCGVDDSFRPLPAAEIAAFKAKHNLPDAFLLFIGTLEPRKNVVGLLQAYAAWVRRDPTAPPLIIGGGKGWYYQEIFALVERLGLTDRVTFPGYLPQPDLRFWYNAATIFVYPSLFEGFGLPVLEAMACGTPVVTSNVSSLPEVAGEAGCLVKPNDLETLSQMMEEVYRQPDIQQKMRQKGFVQQQGFRWQQTAAETRQVYHEVLQR